MSLDPKILITPRKITGRLSSKKVLSLKLFAAFSTSIFKETASIMSWSNQVSTEESRDLISREENALKKAQRL